MRPIRASGSPSLHFGPIPDSSAGSLTDGLREVLVPNELVDALAVDAEQVGDLTNKQQPPGHRGGGPEQA